MTRDQMEELAALDALTALDGEDLAALERARGETPLPCACAMSFRTPQFSCVCSLRPRPHPLLCGNGSWTEPSAANLPGPQ